MGEQVSGSREERACAEVWRQDREASARVLELGGQSPGPRPGPEAGLDFGLFSSAPSNLGTGAKLAV